MNNIGSQDTLFKWGICRKRLHYFAANLFGKLYTKFRQSRPSFVKDISIFRKKQFDLIFPDTLLVFEKLKWHKHVWTWDIILRLFEGRLITTVKQYALLISIRYYMSYVH